MGNDSFLDVVLRTIAAVRDGAAAQCAAVEARCEARCAAAEAHADARCAAVEARPSLKYMGVWRDDATYGLHDVVTRQGSMWVSRCENNHSQPGDGGVSWTLSVKSGRDGRDTR